MAKKIWLTTLMANREESPFAFDVFQSVQKRLQSPLDSRYSRFPVAESPHEADIILFVESNLYKTRTHVSRLLRNELIHRYPARCFAYDFQPEPPPLLPGVYASLPNRNQDRRRIRAGGYLDTYNNAPDRLYEAFYGPKIDFVVRDVIGREWQLGTVQVDYNLPIRFDLSYIGPDSQPHRPVMIHRAPFGSLERFVGVLIEHFAGAFPTWLAPEQVRFLPIADRHAPWCEELKTRMIAQGLRATVDTRSEKTGKKVAEAQVAKVPYMLVVGDRDIEAGNVAVRHRDKGDLGPRPVEEFLMALQTEVETRAIASTL